MRRSGLIILGILWYVVTIGFIITFVQSILSGELFGADDVLGELAAYYFFTWLLGLWQAFFVWRTAKLYRGSAQGSMGIGLFGLLSRGHIVMAIILLLLSPLVLILHLFVTLKTMWLLIRYSPQ